MYQTTGAGDQVNLFDGDGIRIETSTGSGCRNGQLFSLRGPDGAALSDFWSDSGACADEAVWLRDHIYLDGERVATRQNATLAEPAACMRKCCPTLTECAVGGFVANPDFNACRSDGVHIYRRSAAGSYDFTNPLQAQPLLGTCLQPDAWSAALTEPSCFVACAIHNSGERVCGTEACFDPVPEPCNTVCQVNICPPPADPPLATRVSYELRDHLGTPRVTIGDDGVVRGELRLGPFGEVIVEADCSQRMQFTGHERDDATGLDYMRARFYDREIGRFLTADPGSDVDADRATSWNKYSYVRNNPIVSSDPTGTSIWSRVFHVFSVVNGERKRIAAIRNQGTRARTMRQVKKALDKAEKGAKRSVEVRDAATRSKVAEALSTNGRARRPEQSRGNYPRHVNPQEGPYSDVHVETSADVATSRFGMGRTILSALVPLTMATATSESSTPGEIMGAALWDVATTIDPIFLTDGIAWAVDLEYVSE